MIGTEPGFNCSLTFMSSSDFTVLRLWLLYLVKGVLGICIELIMIVSGHHQVVLLGYRIINVSCWNIVTLPSPTFMKSSGLKLLYGNNSYKKIPFLFTWNWLKSSWKQLIIPIKVTFYYSNHLSVPEAWSNLTTAAFSNCITCSVWVYICMCMYSGKVKGDNNEILWVNQVTSLNWLFGKASLPFHLCIV